MWYLKFTVRHYFHRLFQHPGRKLLLSSPGGVEENTWQGPMLSWWRSCINHWWNQWSQKLFHVNSLMLVFMIFGLGFIHFSFVQRCTICSQKFFCFWRRKPTTKEKNFQVLRMELRNLRGSPATDLQTSARRIFPSEIPHIWVISVTESKEIRTEKKHKHPWKIDGRWMRILMTWWMMWIR